MMAQPSDQEKLDQILYKHLQFYKGSHRTQTPKQQNWLNGPGDLAIDPSAREPNRSGWLGLVSAAVRFIENVVRSKQDF